MDWRMPGLNGLKLCRLVRLDPALKHIVFIFVSGRCGEDERLEGIHAGADDYIRKPFAVQELLKGEKSLYPRNLLGFLRDCGLSYIADLDPYRRNSKLKETVFPALDLLKGEAIQTYELDDRGNIFFIPKWCIRQIRYTI